MQKILKLFINVHVVDSAGNCHPKLLGVYCEIRKSVIVMALLRIGMFSVKERIVQI